MGVVTLLLERKDVNPNQADTNHDLIPVLWAAWKGHTRVVRIFVEQNISARDRKDTHEERGGWENLRKIAHDRFLAIRTNEFDAVTPAQSWSEVNNQVQKTLRAAEFDQYVCMMGVTDAWNLEFFERRYAEKSRGMTWVSIPYSALFWNLLWDCWLK